MMGFDSWSLKEKIFVIWGLTIASIAIIFVCVSLGNLVSDNSSNIASWVQAIGSIAAVLFAGYFVKWEIKENKRLDDLKLIEAKEKKLNNVMCVIQDELIFIKSNIKKYDNVFENRYQLKDARNRSGFFKPRPLNPILLSEVMSEYYSEYSFEQRNCIRSILTIYPKLNSYADRCEQSNMKRHDYRRDLDSDEFKNEVVMAMFYVKSGLLYYNTLKEFINNEFDVVPYSHEKEQEIIKNLHADFQLKIDLEFILYTEWKFDYFDNKIHITKHG